MNTNETLGFIGSLTKKIEKGAHELQHLPLNSYDLKILNHLSTKLQEFSFEFHRFEKQFKAHYQEEVPPLDEKMKASFEVLTKLRKFNGHG